MIDLLPESDGINFGELPEEIDALLQQGVIAYRRDRDGADRLFRQALAAAPDLLATYFCLYKIHTYQGNLDEARRLAGEGLRRAAVQAGWPEDWRQWVRPMHEPEGSARFALYTLKALAFIHLRRDETAPAREILATLAAVDPSGSVGWPVVAALAEGLA